MTVEMICDKAYYEPEKQIKFLRNFGSGGYPMDTSVKPTKNDQIESQTNDLNDLKIEYETTNRLLIEKENTLKKVQLGYSPFQHKIEELKQARDRLNEKNRKTRKDIKDAEGHLQYLKWVLSKDENEASKIRAEIESTKRQSKPFETPYQQVYSEYLRLKKSADELKRRITEIEVRLRPQSVKQMRLEIFYVIVLIIITVVLPAISFIFKLPWYVAVIIFVCALLGVWVLSAIQLRNDGKLSEENFLKLMLEAIKQIPELLKGLAKN